VDKKKRELEERELEERSETVPQKKKKTIEVVRKKDLRLSLYGDDCNENTFECLVCQNDACEKCWDKDNNCCNSCTQNQDSNV